MIVISKHVVNTAIQWFTKMFEVVKHITIEDGMAFIFLFLNAATPKYIGRYQSNISYPPAYTPRNVGASIPVAPPHRLRAMSAAVTLLLLVRASRARLHEAL